MTESHIASPRETLPVFCLGCGPMSSAYPLSVEESQATFQLLRQISTTALARVTDVLRSRRRPSSNLPAPSASGGGAAGSPSQPRRRRPVSAQRAATGAAWRFHLLYAAGLLLVLPLLPLLLLARLLPSHGKRQYDETIFAEANRSLLTAIDHALMV